MPRNPDQLDIFPDQIWLRRVDPEQNMRRFYAMTVSRDLFGHGILAREFGRIGQPGRVMTEVFEDEAQAVIALAKQAKAKQRRGYSE